MVYICTKFGENVLNVIMRYGADMICEGWTDRHTDGQTDIYGKNNMSPPEKGRHKTINNMSPPEGRGGGGWGGGDIIYVTKNSAYGMTTTADPDLGLILYFAKLSQLLGSSISHCFPNFFILFLSLLSKCIIILLHTVYTRNIWTLLLLLFY